MELTNKQKQDLVAKGFTKIPGAVRKAQVNAALRDINNMIGQERNPANPGPADGQNNYNEDYWTEIMSTPAIMALLYDTPAWALAESLIGPGRVIRDDRSQIALRFPASRNVRSAPNFHVDNFYYPSGGPPQPPGKFCSFTLLVYVLLNDLPEEYSGNFTVCPGSHRLISKHIREHGIESIRNGSAKIKLPKPEQITGKAGDLVLCHYQVAHDRELNFSPHIRYASFFRLRHIHHESHQLQALCDPWLEWPAIQEALARA